MSVESSVSKVAFTGNNSTVTPYNVPFRIDNATDLVVVARLTATGVETTLAAGQFTVSGLGNPAGCTVTTAAAWPNTYTLTFYREVPATQLTTYASNDSFPAASHERALDKLTYLVQQALRKLGQCFRVTEASTTPTEKPSIPLSVLGLDGAGQLVFRSSQEMVSFLSLTVPLVDNPVATWQDAAERAVKVPDFLGQLGLERSTLKVYHSTGVAAGNWVASQADPSDLSVTTGKIATQAVTNGKLAHIASGTLKGRTSAGTGDVQDITLSQALDLAGNTQHSFLTRGASVWSIFTPYNVFGSTSNLRFSSTSGWFMKANYVPVSAIVQGAGTVISTSIPFDDTPPLSTEGTEVASISVFVEKQSYDSITPLISITFTCMLVPSTAPTTIVAALFRGFDTIDCIYATSQSVIAASNRHTVSFTYVDQLPSFTGGRNATYSVRIGATAGTLTIQGVSGQTLGGLQKTVLTAQVYQS